MGGPPPGKGPGAQDPCFCPTSWSLAGSPSLRQGHAVCGASGGAVVVEVGVIILRVGCGGQGGRGAHVGQTRAGCPLLCQWVLFPGILRSKVFIMSLALCLSGNRAPFYLLQVVVGLGVPTPLGAITSPHRCPAGSAPGHSPILCSVPSFPLRISVQPAQPLPVSHLIRTQN